MKKIISISLVALFLFSMAIPVQAANNVVMLTTNASGLKQGDTFAITASLKGAETAALGTIMLKYDSDLLTLTGGTCHLSGADIGQVIVSKNVGTFLFKDDAQTISGDLFTFYFTVNKDITYTTITATTSMGDTEIHYVDSARVTVSIFKAGDVNGDNSLGNKDVFHLLWHIFLGEDYGICVDGDLNRDGYVTTDDVIYLLWHLLFGSAYPL